MFSKKYKIFYLVGIVTFVLDHASKYWARNYLGGVGQTHSVIENFWDWRMAWNYGSAFSMFSGSENARIFLTIFGLVALVGVFWMMRQTHATQRVSHWAFGLVLGGAVGNIADRIYFGKVTDFIVWRYYDKEWPTFNIADVALVIGIILLLIDSRNNPTPAKGKKSAASS